MMSEPPADVGRAEPSETMSAEDRERLRLYANDDPTGDSLASLYARLCIAHEDRLGRLGQAVEAMADGLTEALHLATAPQDKWEQRLWASIAALREIAGGGPGAEEGLIPRASASDALASPGVPFPPEPQRVYTAPDGSEWDVVEEAGFPTEGQWYLLGGWDPPLVASKDHGRTWCTPGHAPPCPGHPILTPAPTTEEPAGEEQDAGEGEEEMDDLWVRLVMWFYERRGPIVDAPPDVNGLFGEVLRFYLDRPRLHPSPPRKARPDETPTPPDPAPSVPWDQLVGQISEQVRQVLAGPDSPPLDSAFTADDVTLTCLRALAAGGYLVGVQDPDGEGEVRCGATHNGQACVLPPHGERTAHQAPAPEYGPEAGVHWWDP